MNTEKNNETNHEMIDDITSDVPNEADIVMKKKRKSVRLFIIFGVVILVVAAAAFIGGRLLNESVRPSNMISMGDGSGSISEVVSEGDVVQAPELPITQPDAIGTFVSMQDNTLILQEGGGMIISGDGGTVSMESGKIIVSGGPETMSGGVPGDIDAVKIEIVITSETKIYRDATEFPDGPPSEDFVLEQKVEEGDLDELFSQTMVLVWGRKSGDRIIADVISYSNPVMIIGNN